MKVALTIAGSDSSGGAGIQADLKTFQAFHVYGASAITALTAQNTAGVYDIQPSRPDIVKSQIRAVLSDLPVKAAKTGMLFSSEIMDAFIEEWSRPENHTDGIPLIVDPVMISTSGNRLISEDAEKLYFKIFNLAYLITPNLPEASSLLGREIASEDEMRDALRELHLKIKTNILIKGGHLKNGSQALDILYDGKDFTEFKSEFIESRNTHGTGCTLSAAVTACIAGGMDIKEAVQTAKNFVFNAIQTAPDIGSGHGPLNHMWKQSPG